MIHRIQIQNFKSLRDVTVGLSPVTVFIGKSGTGKTNFANAIRFLRDCLAVGPQRAMQQNPSYRCATNSAEPVSFDVEFSVPDFIERFEYFLELDAEHAVNTPRIEWLKYGDRTIFRQIGFTKTGQGQGFHGASHWEAEPALAPLPQPGELALGRLPGIEAAMIAYTALTSAIGIYSFPYDVLRSGQPKQSEQRQTGLSDHGDNALDVAEGINRDLQRVAVRKSIAAALRKINDTIISVEIDPRKPVEAMVGHRLGEKALGLKLSQESDGFRRFYVHLLALYQLPSKQTMVFEEPENGIYPGALSLLADEFKATPDAGRGQVLLTTHSPALLDHFSADHIRVVELADLETQIGTLAEEQRESLRGELLRAGELLTADPARRQEP